MTIVLAAAVATPSSAQTCLGGMPMEGVSLHLGGSLGSAWAPTTSAAGMGRLSFGYRRAFGSVEMFRNQLLKLKFDLWGLGVSGGVRLKMRQSELCPLANYSRSIAEDLGPSQGPFPIPVQISQLTISKSVGLAVGKPVLRKGKVDLVPTATVIVSKAYVRSDVLLGPDGRPMSTVATLQVGCGIVVARRLAFVPSLTTSLWSSAGFDASTSIMGSLVLNLKK